MTQKPKSKVEKKKKNTDQRAVFNWQEGDVRKYSIRSFYMVTGEHAAYHRESSSNWEKKLLRLGKNRE